MKKGLVKIITASVLAGVLSLAQVSAMASSNASNSSVPASSNGSTSNGSSSNPSNLSNASNAAGKSEGGFFELVMNYQSGQSDPDGGVEEIVAYSNKTGMLYSVNGKKGVIDVISTKEVGADKKGKLEKEIDVKSLLGDAIKDTENKDFKYGDMTSIAVSDKEDFMVVSLQDEAHDKAGLAVFLNFEGKILGVAKTGVQPDMVTITPDGMMVLTADEGEPRKGYKEGTTDPEGSVTLIVPATGGKIESTTVDFKEFDGKRDELIGNNVVLKKGVAPSKDLEPEFIAVSEDGKKAYVTLQENNAVAVIDLTSKKAEGVYGLGFKDFSKAGNELDLRKDKKIEIKNENVFGIYMPDAIATYNVGEETYLVTANEGDSREWEEYLNEVEKEDVVYFGKEDYEGLDQSKDYIFGGRSFSVWNLKDGKMNLVYDSGSDFEKITAEKYPEFFNVSNDNLKLDSRSGKKGPEAEGVVVGKIGDKTYAFIALERTGGIMAYDITDPNNITFKDYVNTRDFSEDIKGDVAPEGMVFINGEKPQLGVAYEVSGSVSLFDILAK